MKRLRSILVLVILLGGLVPLAAAQGPVGRTPELRAGALEAPAANGPSAYPGTYPWGTRPVDLSLGAVPAAAGTKPWQIDAAVSLIVDDGGAENYIGLNSTEHGSQFLWLNRFTPAPADFPFLLNTISVVFGTEGVTLGAAVDLVVYQDTDGNGEPSNATVVAVYNETILANDGTTWSNYTLPTPLLLSGPGDVLIAVINRYQESGVGPRTYPAALDSTASQGRSWVASWSADPPNPPALPPDGLWGTIDSFGFAGNWLIRGSGETWSGSVYLPVIYKSAP